ncbi:hypothetical protein BCAR13_1840030 [Paraburkholderia caribensis]|nr:hypothetical protein BCAR13_1840030 [Paraburkholderia caribensis]
MHELRSESERRVGRIQLPVPNFDCKDDVYKDYYAPILCAVATPLKLSLHH